MAFPAPPSAATSRVTRLAQRFATCKLNALQQVPIRYTSVAGQVLRDLVFAKYGKQYDLSIVRRQIAGQTIVALNVMWTHLDQRSFPMSEPEFMEKLDTIAEYLRHAALTAEQFFQCVHQSLSETEGDICARHI